MGWPFLQLHFAFYTALQLKNSAINFPPMNPVALREVGEKYDKDIENIIT